MTGPMSQHMADHVWPKILLFLLGLFFQPPVHIDIGYDCRRTLHELPLVAFHFLNDCVTTWQS